MDGCCHFLMDSGWLLLFPRGVWMVAVVSSICSFFGNTRLSYCMPSVVLQHTQQQQNEQPSNQFVWNPLTMMSVGQESVEHKESPKRLFQKSRHS